MQFARIFLLPVSVHYDIIFAEVINNAKRESEITTTIET
jgi:hypothetical protein